MKVTSLTVTASCCRPLNGFLLVNSSWCRFNIFTAHSYDNFAFCHLWVVVSSTNHLSLWSVVFRFGLQVLHSTITLSYTSVMSWYYLHLRFLWKVSAGTLMNIKPDLTWLFLRFACKCPLKTFDTPIQRISGELKINQDQSRRVAMSRNCVALIRRRPYTDLLSARHYVAIRGPRRSTGGGGMRRTGCSRWGFCRYSPGVEKVQDWWTNELLRKPWVLFPS